MEAVDRIVPAELVTRLSPGALQEVADGVRSFQRVAQRRGLGGGNLFPKEISERLSRPTPDTAENRAMIERLRPAVQRYRDIGVRIEDVYLITAAGLWLLWRSREEFGRPDADRVLRPVLAPGTKGLPVARLL